MNSRDNTRIQTATERVRRVTATDAARRFSDLLNRVHYNREVFVVERGGNEICAIRPVDGGAGMTGDDLANLVAALSHRKPPNRPQGAAAGAGADLRPALLDASVVLAAESGEVDLARLAEQHGARHLALAAVSIPELIRGVERLRSSARKARAAGFLESVLSAVPVLPFELVAARAQADLERRLARKNVDALDIMIGALALSRGLAVLTRERRGLIKIPDLEVLSIR